MIMALTVTMAICVWSQTAPLQPPDLTKCSQQSKADLCCLAIPSANRPPRQFMRNASIPFGYRYSASEAFQNPAYVTKITKAYQVLRNLSVTHPLDPRSLEHHRRTHCAFCSNGQAYGTQYAVHGNWYFIAWHRMFIYYHERILAWASGDPSFKLAYWEWDSLEATSKSLPSPYAKQGSPLHWVVRNSEAKITHLVGNVTRRAILRASTLEADKWQLFFGGRLGANQYGSADDGPHAAIHFAVGPPQTRGMGSLNHAAIDPIFYAHHANVDRLVDLWVNMPAKSREKRSKLKTSTTSTANVIDKNRSTSKSHMALSGRESIVALRDYPSNRIWRDSCFVFYDEEATPRITCIKDILDTSFNLRYAYPKRRPTWLSEDELPGFTQDKDQVLRGVHRGRSLSFAVLQTNIHVSPTHSSTTVVRHLHGVHVDSDRNGHDSAIDDHHDDKEADDEPSLVLENNNHCRRYHQQKDQQIECHRDLKDADQLLDSQGQVGRRSPDESGASRDGIPVSLVVGPVISSTGAFVNVSFTELIPPSANGDGLRAQPQPSDQSVEGHGDLVVTLRGMKLPVRHPVAIHVFLTRVGHTFYPHPSKSSFVDDESINSPNYVYSCFTMPMTPAPSSSSASYEPISGLRARSISSSMTIPRTTKFSLTSALRRLGFDPDMPANLTIHMVAEQYGVHRNMSMDLWIKVQKMYLERLQGP
ncbi:hypothetical protein CBR_g4497 [Chara braunii]|uniref:Tyrosinase copper-binding domain-containing protein n=1 Tax=Chara braunii TaxID=69332 RepID=A0A388KI27_CHABU|nr:hypothetical protein CBR_g4497 [Chara braunii]|eukprot:GBG69667.1 hypothetical protein CBR_g4497 [Chara braunii]